MRWTSLFTMPLGLTEPLFVPEVLELGEPFTLAHTTGFDVESLISALASKAPPSKTCLRIRESSL
jgi:hypothetical protein